MKRTRGKKKKARVESDEDTDYNFTDDEAPPGEKSKADVEWKELSREFKNERKSVLRDKQISEAERKAIYRAKLKRAPEGSSLNLKLQEMREKDKIRKREVKAKEKSKL